MSNTQVIHGSDLGSGLEIVAGKVVSAASMSTDAEVTQAIADAGTASAAAQAANDAAQTSAMQADAQAKADASQAAATSAAQAMVAASDASNAATNAAQDAAMASALNNLAYRGATTFEVGAGKPYSSVNQVLDLLRDKILVSPILIKVADGIHEWTNISLHRHPYAHKIRIEGNVANPANCVIRWIPDAAGNSHGMVIVGSSGLNISGFTLIGSATDSNFTYRNIYLDGSTLFCDKNSMIIDGGNQGIEVLNGSAFIADGINIKNIKQSSVVIRSSRANIPNAHIVGFGKGSEYTMPARLGGATVKAKGIWAISNSLAEISGANISGMEYGVVTESGSQVYANWIAVDACTNGCFATFAGNLQSFNNAEGVGAAASNCDRGFMSDLGSNMYLKRATAIGCSVTGFRASGGGSLYNHDGGYARNCAIGYQSTTGGLVGAHGAAANSSGNTVNYNVDADSKLIWS